jgi:hypothetical protein
MIGTIECSVAPWQAAIDSKAPRPFLARSRRLAGLGREAIGFAGRFTRARFSALFGQGADELTNAPSSLGANRGRLPEPWRSAGYLRHFDTSR